MTSRGLRMLSYGPDTRTQCKSENVRDGRTEGGTHRVGSRETYASKKKLREAIILKKAEFYENFS